MPFQAWPRPAGGGLASWGPGRGDPAGSRVPGGRTRGGRGQLRDFSENRAGKAWTWKAVWEFPEVLLEVLSPRHDAQRVDFEAAPAPLRQALGFTPFVGPIVTWDDRWGEVAPKVGGETMNFVPEQLLGALVAVVSGGDAPTELAFLFHEGEVLDENEGDPEDLACFVTSVPLERLLLAPAVRSSAAPAG